MLGNQKTNKNFNENRDETSLGCLIWGLVWGLVFLLLLFVCGGCFFGSGVGGGTVIFQSRLNYFLFYWRKKEKKKACKNY